MNTNEMLTGKRVLIVDDEADVLETLSDILEMCRLDKAVDFDSARRLLEKNTYDLAILDIMGVQGYDLLDLTRAKDIPTLMFTAHALSPEALMQSLEGGAKAYIPKEKMADIAEYAAEILDARARGIEHPGNWFVRLKSFFDRQFGSEWRELQQEARNRYPWLDFDD